MKCVHVRLIDLSNDIETKVTSYKKQIRVTEIYSVLLKFREKNMSVQECFFSHHLIGKHINTF